MTSNSTWNPSAQLTLGLSEEDKELIEKAYVYARPFLERILELLDKEVQRSIEDTDQVSKYSEPNWPLLQSYISGQRAAFKYFRKLIKNKDKVDHDL